MTTWSAGITGGRVGEVPGGTALDATGSATGAAGGASTGAFAVPSIQLPRGGGSVRGLAEHFSAAVTGEAALGVPLGLPAGRAGMTPPLALSYSSQAGPGAFGLGWSLGLGTVQLRTEGDVPSYEGDDEVLLAGAQLVPHRDGGGVATSHARTVAGRTYRVTRFRPRVGTGADLVERWTDRDDSTDVRWRVLTAANTTTWFGRDGDSRIYDPADPRRAAVWLPSITHDDRGNAIRYRYRREDDTGVDRKATAEIGRSGSSRGAQRYLTRVSWANRTPYLPELAPGGEPTPEPDDWSYHLVCDYGDHDLTAPGIDPDPDNDWQVRPDPHSSRRTGFEVRTYRRCRRTLVFHAFPELGDRPVLVTSTTLAYDDGVPSLLTEATRTGHHPDGTDKSLPALRCRYAPWIPASEGTAVDTADAGLPSGLDGRVHEWVDLDGDGLGGVLVRGDDAWWYRRNLSPLSLLEPGFPQVRLAAPRPVPEVVAGLPDGPGRAGQRSLVDVDGDGVTDVLLLDGPAPGVVRRGAGGGTFAPFPSAPAGAGGTTVPGEGDRTWGGLAVVDLTGDGRPDVVVSDGLATRWHRGSGIAGFAPGVPIRTAPGDDGPVTLGEDTARATRFADMTGDGLADLVEITGTTISYRPGLGHGRFGPRVHMAECPDMTSPDAFDPSRVLLADVDGAGPADLIVLGSRSATVHRNLGGDRWGPGQEIATFPGTDRADRVDVVDLLGRGTGCLVWSTAPSAPGDRALAFVDLAATGKPYLLAGWDNGLGAEVTLTYTPSTAYALADGLDGHPWPGLLPFPVHCVSRIVTRDAVRGTTTTTTRTYHHGRYDGTERRFTGFGRIDQRDADEVAGGPFDQPPVLVRRWFHTGAAAAEGDAALHTARAEYAKLAGPTLDEPALPHGLDAEARRQAALALAGTELRSETFAEDGSDRAGVPYAVSEQAVAVRQLQPPRPGGTAGRQPRPEPGVYQVVPVSSLAVTGERDADDARTSETVALDVDDLGTVVEAVTVLRPRRVPDPTAPPEARAAQARAGVLHARRDLTADVVGPDVRRLRLPHRTRTHELTGWVPTADAPATVAELVAAVAAAAVVDPDTVPDPTAGPTLRLLSASDITYLADDLAAPLPPGVHAAHGLSHRTRALALTDAMATARLGGVADVPDLAALGHEHIDGGWWVPSGTEEYDADARAHFLQPRVARDPLGVPTRAEYLHDLFVTAVENARGHRSTAEVDLVHLAAHLVTDANGNRTAVRRDPLGVVVAAAVMGRAGAGEGDTLDDPTVRVDYDLSRWRAAGAPAVVRSFARERHGDPGTPWQETVTYLDGSGAGLAVKTQAAPGRALHWDEAAGAAVEVDTTPELRWIGTGRTVVDNKGRPVLTYEPYFTDSPAFDSAAALVELGVATVTRYDPLGRPVQVDHPDGTHARLEITPWRAVLHDAIDTVLDSTWYAERGSPDPAGPRPADPAERAAWDSAQHAATPVRVHTDVAGRSVATEADAGGGAVVTTTVAFDLTGLRRAVRDARGRLVAEAHADLLGRVLAQDTAERGLSRVWVDVVGNVVATVDGAGRRYEADHDDLHRPVRIRAVPPGQAPRTLALVRWGDEAADAGDRNAVGRPVGLLDGAGRVQIPSFDFTGAPTRTTRRLITGMVEADWAVVADAADPLTAADALLDTEEWTETVTHDALGRPTRIDLADGSLVQPGYDAGNALVTLDVTSPVRPAVRVLDGADHDPAGRPLRRQLGNGVTTTFDYDPLSRRLVQLRSVAATGTRLQDVGYVHDATGKVVSVTDASQQTAFFANAVVSPHRAFTYDALGRLVLAEGRELAALGQPTRADVTVQPLLHQNDTQAVHRYEQRYEYDWSGNLTEVRHAAGGAVRWRRRYRYAVDEDPTDRTNRLVATSAPGDADGVHSEAYTYDALGNLEALPGGPTLTWGLLGQLASADLGGGGTAHYTHGTGGRVRKVLDRGGTTEETLTLGAVEVHRIRRNGVLAHERRTVRVGGSRIDRIVLDEGTVVDRAPVLRWVLGDHLGSAELHLNQAGDPVLREEYHPYGTTAYRSAAPGEDISVARYRFLGRERDDETGLYHLGARSYAPWLGRWISPDPAGFVDGLNLYAYARNSPSMMTDPGGMQSEPQQRPRVWRVDERTWGTDVRIRTFEQLRTAVHATGHALAPGVTAENFREFVDPETGHYAVVGPPLATGNGDAAAGAGSTGEEGNADAPVTSAPRPPPPEPRPPGPGRENVDPPTAEEDDSDATARRSAPSAARMASQEAARPQSTTGARPRGPLHLWSGEEGKASAQRTIAREGTGWTMGDIEGHPTPQHAQAEERWRTAPRDPATGRVPEAVRDRIWGPSSAEVVGRGAYAGHPVEAHGTPAPNSIQPRYEWPARAVGGSLAGAFGFAGGMYAALTAGQEPDAALAITQVIVGVSEATSGIIYASGAVGGSATAMGIGTVGMTFFGGAGAAIGFGTAAVRAQRQGDTAGALAYGLGALGGALLVASLFTPIGWIGVAGAILVGFASGFAIGRWLGS